MTKREAWEAMKQGHKITHIRFSKEEFIYMNDQGLITTEDGYFFHKEFRDRRIGVCWEEGWSIYEPELVTANK